MAHYAFSERPLTPIAGDAFRPPRIGPRQRARQNEDTATDRSPKSLRAAGQSIWRRLRRSRPSSPTRPPRDSSGEHAVDVLTTPSPHFESVGGASSSSSLAQTTIRRLHVKTPSHASSSPSLSSRSTQTPNSPPLVTPPYAGQQIGRFARQQIDSARPSSHVKSPPKRSKALPPTPTYDDSEREVLRPGFSTRPSTRDGDFVRSVLDTFLPGSMLDNFDDEGSSVTASFIEDEAEEVDEHERRYWELERRIVQQGVGPRRRASTHLWPSPPARSRAFRLARDGSCRSVQVQIVAESLPDRGAIVSRPLTCTIQLCTIGVDSEQDDGLDDLASGVEGGESFVERRIGGAARSAQSASGRT